MTPSGAWMTVTVTIVIFVVTHIVITVWWASKVTTILDRVQIDLRDVVAEMKAARNVYVSKEDFSARIALSEKEHEAMWKRIDALTAIIKLPAV